MEHMVDVILHLVDRGLLDELMAMSVGEISSAMEASGLRGSRPEADPRFHRDFDVDLEGEVLELIDDSDGLGEGSSLAEEESDSAMELSLLLARWCSTAQWTCWDARLFLYLEPFIESPLSGQDAFLDHGVWEQFSEAHQGLTDLPTPSQWCWTGCQGERIWGRLWSPLRTR